ncbi:MAG: four helix bundle protein [Gemmataceae bacterium]
MALIASFRDLEVYQIARAQSKRIFILTKLFPKEERYSLTDQMRRASRAVNAMVAEAWPRRRYPAAFVNKISEAMSQAMETQSWLDHALDCEYIDPSAYRDINDGWQKVGAMLNRMIEMSDSFCRPSQTK